MGLNDEKDFKSNESDENNKDLDNTDSEPMPEVEPKPEAESAPEAEPKPEVESAPEAEPKPEVESAPEVETASEANHDKENSEKFSFSEKDFLNGDIPSFKSGDTISVGVKVSEGNKTRIQTFKGVVIKISSGSGLSKSFTVRKVSNGIGVERIFPLHSPNIESIELVKRGKVRRAKLYYLRKLKGKAARVRERA